VLLGATNLVTGDQMFGPKRPPLAQFDCHCRLRNGHAVALDVRRRGEREQVSLSAQTQAQVATVMLEQRLALTLEEHSRGLQVGELAVEKFGLRLARDWVLPCALDLSRYQGLPRAWRDRLWRVPFLRGVGRKPILRQGDSIQGAMLLELAPLATRDRRGPPAKLVSERRVLDQHDLIAAMFWLAEASNSSPFFLGGLQVECRGGPPQVFFRQPTWAALVAELLRLEAAG
jgi:hypothetical protein